MIAGRETGSSEARSAKRSAQARAAGARLKRTHLQVLVQSLARATPQAAVRVVLAHHLGEEALLLVLPPVARADRQRRAPRVRAVQAVP